MQRKKKFSSASGEVAFHQMHRIVEVQKPGPDVFILSNQMYCPLDPFIYIFLFNL